MLVNAGEHHLGQLDAAIQQQLWLNQPSGAFREHNVLSPTPHYPHPPTPRKKVGSKLHCITTHHYFSVLLNDASKSDLSFTPKSWDRPHWRLHYWCLERNDFFYSVALPWVAFHWCPDVRRNRSFFRLTQISRFWLIRQSEAMQVQRFNIKVSICILRLVYLECHKSLKLFMLYVHVINLCC